jgi:hypothetical protein
MCEYGIKIVVKETIFEGVYLVWQSLIQDDFQMLAIMSRVTGFDNTQTIP